jgi:acetyl-CoA C-acetyltransferase
MTTPVYVLGGYQTDFARNWSKEGKDFSDAFGETVAGTLDATSLEASEIEVAHVGNFAAELYCNQGHLGGFFAELDPAFAGVPTGRHEAACASGSLALMMASAEIEAGRYGSALILGLEQMKTVDPATGGDYLGTAAWFDQEAKGVAFPFPSLFAGLGDVYEERYGLKQEHLTRIAEINYTNARRNPHAQTRAWFDGDVATQICEGKYDRDVAGRLRVRDCSQITDGAVGLVVASEEFAAQYAAKRGVELESIPRVLGWGHTAAAIKFETKLAQASDSEYVLPQTRRAIQDALGRAGLEDIFGVDGVETHDCFTTSQYMAIDHFGLTPPGQSWQAIEEGVIDFDGELPFNASGGLIGGGHPVGATGVRQILDAHRQVTGTAGDYQIEGASKIATLNIGGSATTSVATIIGR